MSERSHPTTASRAPDRLWMALLAAAAPLSVVLFLTVMLPLRDRLLVCWIDSADAYAAGLRVAAGKPTHLSDGQLVGIVPDLVTGLGGFACALMVSMLAAAGVYGLIRRIRAR